MTFDSSLAWKQASAAIMANKEVLLVLAGVFFLLPSLALQMFFPQPEPVADMNQEQMAAMISAYYRTVLPVLIPILLCQALGTLSLLTMLTDWSRPTVGEAIKRGVRGIIPYLAAQLLLGLGLGGIATLLLSVLAATGVAALGAIGIALVLAALVYVAVRTALVGPVIAVEGVSNPITALKRSWRLMANNSLRVVGFFALVLLAFLVISLVTGIVVGLPLSLLATPLVTTIVTALVSSAMNAIMALVFIAVIAAVHRQLSGQTPDDEAHTFE